MFVDEVIVSITAGKGGDGCTSFRREKYVEMGGPNGGNGGSGASIIFRVDNGLKTLIDLKMMKVLKGNKGVNGKGSNRNGANADNIYIDVPPGTTVTDLATNEIIADLVYPGEEALICRGGRGGRGNRAFATHDNPAPRMSELGEPGEFRKVKCELKVLADVGLVGLPSVGKSTIINAITNANAKIGAYHFTTLNPNLGVVKLGDDSFVMADLPGLIEGASEGIGLGHKFLRHAMRTKVIAHVIDASAEEGRDPILDFDVIYQELKKYDELLINKPHIIIANKMDVPGSSENLKRFKEKYHDEEIYEISAKTGEGLDKVLERLNELVKSLDEVNLYKDTMKESHVLYKFEDASPFTITKDNDVWVVSGKEIETLFYMTRFDEEESVERFGRKLRGMGVDTELEKMGAKRGDEVQILDYMFVFKD